MIHLKIIQWFNQFLGILKCLLVILIIFLRKSKGLLEESIATLLTWDNSFALKFIQNTTYRNPLNKTKYLLLIKMYETFLLLVNWIPDLMTYMLILN